VEKWRVELWGEDKAMGVEEGGAAAVAGTAATTLACVCSKAPPDTLPADTVPS
jgi:hypothetical protein